MSSILGSGHLMAVASNAVVPGYLPLLMNEASFQASWFFSLIIFCVSMIALVGGWLVFRQIPSMWRDGNRTMALTLGASAVVVLISLALLILVVVIALYPYAAGTV